MIQIVIIKVTRKIVYILLIPSFYENLDLILVQWIRLKLILELNFQPAIDAGTD